MWKNQRNKKVMFYRKKNNYIFLFRKTRFHFSTKTEDNPFLRGTSNIMKVGKVNINMKY